MVVIRRHRLRRRWSERALAVLRRSVLLSAVSNCCTFAVRGALLSQLRHVGLGGLRLLLCRSVIRGAVTGHALYHLHLGGQILGAFFPTCLAN